MLRIIDPTYKLIASELSDIIPLLASFVVRGQDLFEILGQDMGIVDAIFDVFRHSD
tara:strand:- start:1142 stop:1309 length:168 start_codon:yes stop_codon:yes gene_type:complete